MSPPLTSYSDFHDSDIRGPFEQFHSILICDLLNLHFQLKAALDVVATKDPEPKPDEEQKNDDKPEDNAEQKASESDNKEKKLQQSKDTDFISKQIIQKLNSYPMPKLVNQINIDSVEQLYKLKLLDFSERIVKMSAVEFDQISLGRIEKQTEESCFEIVRILFEGVKMGIAVFDEIDRK